MSRDTLEILVIIFELLDSRLCPPLFRPLTERLSSLPSRHPRRFTFTRNRETLSRRFSLSLFPSLCAFRAGPMVLSPKRAPHPYFAVAAEISLRSSIPWPFHLRIKEETGLKETHNVAEGSTRVKRERETKLEREEGRGGGEMELIRTVKAYERLKCG